MNVSFIQLSDYAIESEDATGDDPSYRPARQNVLEKRRTRHSFGCCRDMDWQRRMEGFTDLNIVVEPIQSRSSARNSSILKLKGTS